MFNFYTNIVGNIPLITLPQSPADDALSINGNGGNAGDTGLPDEWKAPKIYCWDYLYHSTTDMSWVHLTTYVKYSIYYTQVYKPISVWLD